MPPALPTLEELQEEWKQIYQQSLPAAARSKSPSQPIWPVHNDHCFARIILDSIVGVSSPWTSKLKAPAYKNMSTEQLQDSIDLAEQILIGEVDLVELNERSLELRGKRKKQEGLTTKRGITPDEEDSTAEADSDDISLVKSRKIKREDQAAKKKHFEPESEDDLAVQPIKKRKMGSEEQMIEADLHSDGIPNHSHPSKPLKNARIPPVGERLEDYEPAQQPSPPTEDPPQTSKPSDLTPYLKKIALSTKTPFQKRVLSLLCQVPSGQYTTYGAISKHLNSSPRAVGNAIRNNPFAPHVPCHRILATGGGIGGFHGSWGKNGEAGLNDDWKRKLLREEGLRFDGKGKVVGKVWEGFK